MNENEYIDRVLAFLPRATPLRAQIAMELRGHIAERMSQGQSLEEAVSQLGDPAVLAGSYLSAVPEAGTPIGWGQSVVRQLPMALQILWIDVFFALFTDRRQRAFEMLSKTRVVTAGAPSANETAQGTMGLGSLADAAAPQGRNCDIMNLTPRPESDNVQRVFRVP